MSYFAKILRFERRANTLVPVVATSTQQPDGSLKCIRVTEGRFPLGPDAWNANAEDWASALLHEHYYASYQFNTRAKLYGAGDIASDVSGSYQPILQPPSEAPIYGPYLGLDAVALQVHVRDAAAGFAGCDNPWVASLYGEPEDESEGA